MMFYLKDINLQGEKYFIDVSFSASDSISSKGGKHNAIDPDLENLSKFPTSKNELGKMDGIRNWKIKKID
jgi:hypothetical protein